MRKISKNKYVMAALITAGIFILGFFLGLLIEQQRVNYIEAQGEIQRLNFDSLQLQYLYVDQLSQEKNCGAVIKAFEDSVEALESARKRLETFDDDQTISDDEFLFQKREYTLAQVRYWLLNKRTGQLCDSDSVSILYFYSIDEECPQCEDQAFILNYFKGIFKQKLLVFAIDSNLEQEPLVNIMRSTYDIDKYPTLVIEDEVFHGLTSKDDILKAICRNLDQNEEACN